MHKKLAPPMSNKMYPRTFSGLPAVQVNKELEDFLKFLHTLEIKSYLEIGCARGDTFYEVVSQLPIGSKAVAVDYPEQLWGLNSSAEMLAKVSKSLNEAGYITTVILGNSTDKAIIQEASKFAPFDLVFIDGDHTYEGVKADWDNYAKWGKMIAFHDIVDSQLPNLKGEIIEVPRFWNELKQKYRHIEFVEKGSTMGIGVIFRDS